MVCRRRRLIRNKWGIMNSPTTCKGYPVACPNLSLTTFSMFFILKRDVCLNCVDPQPIIVRAIFVFPECFVLYLSHGALYPVAASSSSTLVFGGDLCEKLAVGNTTMAPYLGDVRCIHRFLRSMMALAYVRERIYSILWHMPGINCSGIV